MRGCTHAVHEFGARIVAVRESEEIVSVSAPVVNRECNATVTLGNKDRLVVSLRRA